MRRTTLAVLAVVLMGCTCLGSAGEILQGFSFGAMWWPVFDEDLITYNLCRLAGVGVNSIILIVDWYVESYTDPVVRPFYRHEPGFPDTNWFYPTLYDDEVEFIIHAAHSLGMSVMLKPHVETLDNMETMLGRADLRPSGGRWNELFASYQEYMNHYAAMCEQLGVEILCLGCEMESMTHSAPNADQRWRRMIAEVREIYSGELTYSCAIAGSNENPWSSPNRITFWDALDYIGFEFYRGLTSTRNPSLEQLRAGVREVFDDYVEPLARTFDRPVLIPEINFMHCDGTNMAPYSPFTPPGTRVDYQEHADCHRAVMSVIADILEEKDYFKGIYWWSGELVYPWVDLTPDTESEECIGTAIWGTPAEEVIREFWEGTNGWRVADSAEIAAALTVDPEAAAGGCAAQGHVHDSSDLAILEAIPGEGWIFDRWEGAPSGSAYSLLALSREWQDSLTAVFLPAPWLPYEGPAPSSVLPVGGLDPNAEWRDCFWFVGGENALEVEPSGERDHETVVCDVPTVGAGKLSLRFDPPLDASAYDGVQFTARASRALPVRIEIASQDPGLHGLANDDDWKSSLPPLERPVLLGTEPRTFRFPFRVFRDDPWLIGEFTDVSWLVETDAIWEIQFIPEGGGATLEILDFFLYSDGG
ncbi:hypothetical protein ACFLSF_00125 [Candidatus Bipolaricaulota bacterium]